MRRDRGLKRGAAIIVLLTGAVGYAAGDWRTTTVRGTGLTAAQTVALRFPEDWNDGSAADSDIASPAAGGMNSVNAVFPVALLSPAPMMPQGSGLAPAQPAPQQSAQTASPVPQPASPAAQVQVQVQVASADARHVPPREVRQAQLPASTAQRNAARDAAIAEHHRTNRPGYLLNDAQIASIKQRLNLTPDQEQMWPAVEAALRNIAYAKARDERWRKTNAETQSASIDPDSAEVQGLKSAAVPLIMSFSTEQKEEVRNIAHVMGLDQLAAQF
jgi:hypothetical protein